MSKRNRLFFAIVMVVGWSCSSNSEIAAYDEVEFTEVITIKEPDVKAEEATTDVDEFVSKEFLSQAFGDLDKDGVDERVQVVNTGDEGEMGLIREIVIYKMSDGKWIIWKTTTGAAMPSEHGGMMGDPFINVEIRNGALIFHNSGGSREKWSYIHRFRFQNEKWELIGASVLYGVPCEGWEEFDYNLSNGNITLDVEPDYCDDNEEMEYPEEKHSKFNVKQKTLPQMDGFYPGNNQINLDENTIYYY